MKKISMNQQGAWAIAILVAGLGYGVVGAVLFKGTGGEAQAAKEHDSHQTIRADDEGEGGNLGEESHGQQNVEALKENGEAKEDHGAAATKHNSAEAESAESQQSNGAPKHHKP